MTQSNTPVPTCRRGHPRAPENTIRWPGGGQQCRTCKQERQAEYYRANSDQIKAQVAEWRATNREQIKARDTEYYAANRDQIKIQKAEYRARLRQRALDAYGRECACCGEPTERFLTIDHVNNNGADHRRRIGSGGLTVWLKREGYPPGFQTLCTNCNHGKHANGGDCPHQAPAVRPATAQQRHYHRLKRAALGAYGGACSCCGENEPMFLTIDHVNNDGAEHRREVGGSGKATYRWLKRERWPGGFRVLCFNCNVGRHFNSGVCPHEELAG